MSVGSMFLPIRKLGKSIQFNVPIGYVDRNEDLHVNVPVCTSMYHYVEDLHVSTSMYQYVPFWGKGAVTKEPSYLLTVSKRKGRFAPEDTGK